jgi:hypothetical protein
MRPEHLSPDGSPRWEARAFINEADFLIRLASSPVPDRLYDCGFVSASGERPDTGSILSLGTNVAVFKENLYPYIAQQWRPYLALELLPRHHSLFYVMKPNAANGRRRPTGRDRSRDAVRRILASHDQRILYLDHRKRESTGMADLRVIDQRLAAG